LKAVRRQAHSLQKPLTVGRCRGGR
jgi:hypothetical protein